MGGSVNAGSISALPLIRKARRIQGRTLALLDAGQQDAAFIHGLRTDPVRARFLSAVPPELEALAEFFRVDPLLLKAAAEASAGEAPAGPLRAELVRWRRRRRGCGAMPMMRPRPIS